MSTLRCRRGGAASLYALESRHFTNAYKSWQSRHCKDVVLWLVSNFIRIAWFLFCQVRLIPLSLDSVGDGLVSVSFCRRSTCAAVKLRRGQLAPRSSCAGCRSHCAAVCIDAVSGAKWPMLLPFLGVNGWNGSL